MTPRRNDLKATPIVDKNGKLTTVHKRMASQTNGGTLSSLRSMIPKAVNRVSNGALAVDTADYLVQRLVEINNHSVHKKAFNDTRATLLKYFKYCSKETLLGIHRVEEPRHVMSVIALIVERHGTPEDTVRDFVELQSVLKSARYHSEDYVFSLLRSLKDHSDLPPYGNPDDEKERFEQARAIITVIDAFSNEPYPAGSSPFHIHEKAMEDLILRSEYTPREVADAVVKQHATSAAHAIEILNLSSTAFRDGVL